MRKFWMSILTVVLVSSFGFPWSESYDTTKIFEIQGNNIIRLSIESYKEKGGWTPVVLSIGDLEVSLWMNASGQVAEMQMDESRPVHSIFRINLSKYEMMIGKRNFNLIISEQNRVRQRMSLFNKNVPFVLKINREREQVEFYIGDSKLKFNHISAEFREIDPGMYELRFGPATVHTMSRLIYWETSGNIYATDQRSGPVDLEKSHIWAKKVD
jgi:hypothetical protein